MSILNVLAFSSGHHENLGCSALARAIRYVSCRDCILRTHDHLGILSVVLISEKSTLLRCIWNNIHEKVSRGKYILVRCVAQHDEKAPPIKITSAFHQGNKHAIRIVSMVAEHYFALDCYALFNFFMFGGHICCYESVIDH